MYRLYLKYHPTWHWNDWVHVYGSLLSWEFGESSWWPWQLPKMAENWWLHAFSSALPSQAYIPVNHVAVNELSSFVFSHTIEFIIMVNDRNLVVSINLVYTTWIDYKNRILLWKFNFGRSKDMRIKMQIKKKSFTRSFFLIFRLLAEC